MGERYQPSDEEVKKQEEKEKARELVNSDAKLKYSLFRLQDVYSRKEPNPEAYSEDEVAQLMADNPEIHSACINFYEDPERDLDVEVAYSTEANLLKRVVEILREKNK